MTSYKYNGRRNDYFEHISVDIPKDMKRAIEKYGCSVGKNKSQVVREAITQFLKENYFPQSINNVYNLKK